MRNTLYVQSTQHTSRITFACTHSFAHFTVKTLSQGTKESCILLAQFSKSIQHEK